MKLIKGLTLITAAGMLAACGSDSDGEAPINYPSTYAFDSKVVDGESSVKFTGQAARQLLISELKAATGDSEVTEAELQAIYDQGVTYLQGQNIYTAAGTGSTAVPVSAETEFTLVQADYADVFTGAGSKKLSDKTAGCDNDLSADRFIGWTVGTLEACDGTSTPTYHDSAFTLMNEWIAAAANGKVDTTLGLDYSQLFQKFLLGAVAFSQTAEDYLSANHVKDGKGLKASNRVDADEQDPDAYTSLEHAWDEGFGYFGASLDYLSIADETIAAGDKVNQSDVSGDYLIDLLKGEYNYGLAQYASKHDYMTRLDSQPTDLSKEIMVAFLEGRQLITDNHGITPVVGDALHTRLAGISDRAVKGLEKVIAISVVKYINSTIYQVEAYPSVSEQNKTSPENLAKYFSELKGFALGLQFNPSPVLSFADQDTLHNKIGQAPVTSITADKAAYLTALKDARALVVTAFGFDAIAAADWK